MTPARPVLRALAAVTVLLPVLLGCDVGPAPPPPERAAAPAPDAAPPGPAPLPAPEQDALPPAPRSGEAFPASTVVSALGGLPEAGLERLAADPAVGQVVVVRTGALAVASGLPLYPEIPVEAVAAEPDEFGAASGDPSLSGLLDRGAVLSRTSATLRGLGAGDVLRLLGGREVPVSGVVEDATVGGYEVAVSGGLGRELGVTTVGYALVSAAGGDGPAALADAARRALPAKTLRIRAPGERPFARRGDEVLPQALLKVAFGEFAIRRSGGTITQDPSWASAHLVEGEVPLLGRTRCHRRLLAALVPAMREVVRRGLSATVRPEEFGGCHAVRSVRGASALSRHAWGAAVDINVASNPLGAEPVIDRRLVEILERHGLRWGGRFLRPDGQHFEGYGTVGGPP